MELVHLPCLSQATSLPTISCSDYCGTGSPRARALLALVATDDEGALSPRRAALPDACFFDLPFHHSAQTPAVLQNKKFLARQNLLTHRQSEIFALMLDGVTDKPIGRHIDILHFTVRNHVARRIQILTVPNRRDVRRALLDAMPSEDAGIAISPATAKACGHEQSGAGKIGQLS